MGSSFTGPLKIKKSDGSKVTIVSAAGVLQSDAALDAGAIGTAELADDAVTTVKVLDANVTEAKLAASSGFGLGVLRTARAKYDFAVDGGVSGAITLATTASLPDNAVIVGGTVNSTTAATSDGSATIAIGFTAGGAADDVLAAAAVASFTTDALINSDIVFAAPIKMTAAGDINVTVAVADLTAGVIEVSLLYFVAAA